MIYKGKYTTYTEEEIIIGALEDAIYEQENFIRRCREAGFEANDLSQELLRVRKEVLKNLQKN